MDIKLRTFTSSSSNIRLTLRVGFEPTREDPIWFQVKRLNHSAIAAHSTLKTWFLMWCSSYTSLDSFQNHASECRDPGLNQGPSDLQSDALPTELSRLIYLCLAYLPDLHGLVPGKFGKRPSWRSDHPSMSKSSKILLTSSLKLDLKMYTFSSASLAASRIRTYAGRSHLISSQTP